MEKFKVGDYVVYTNPIRPGGALLTLGEIYKVDQVTVDGEYVWLDGMVGWFISERFVLSSSELGTSAPNPSQPQENPF